MARRTATEVSTPVEIPAGQGELDPKAILAEYERLRGTPETEDDEDLGDMIRQESDQLGLSFLGTMASIWKERDLGVEQKGDMSLEFTWSTVLDKAFGLLESKLHLPLRGWVKQGKELMSWVTKKGKEIEEKFLN